MADFSALIQRIKDAVYENGVQAITGQILQDCLKDVVNTVNVAKQDGIYRVTVTVDNNTGVPSATARMDDDTYTLEFSFHNLKGETGPQGPQGDTPVLTADSDGVIYSDGVMLTRVIKDTTDALTTRADSDHVRAESDHARAETDHTDITRARGDAETAAGEANYASLRANTAADNADAAREAIQSDLAQKQDVIPDLQQIRAGATDTVKYSTQSLTDAQKEQARTNIGAADESEVSQLRSEVDGNELIAKKSFIGGWYIYKTNPYYKTNNTARVGVGEITLDAGDIISLTDYSACRMYVGYRDANGYNTPGAWLTSDYTAPVSGIYVITLDGIPAVPVSDTSDLTKYLRVIRGLSQVYRNGVTLNDLKSDVARKSTNNDLSNQLYCESLTQGVEYELGNILITNSAWTYEDSVNRVRTPSDYILHLFPGDKITLSNYSGVRFYVGARYVSGSMSMAGWLTSDYIVQEEGYFCVLVANTTDTQQLSPDTLGQLIKVVRNTTVRSMIGSGAASVIFNNTGTTQVIGNRIDLVGQNYSVAYIGQEGEGVDTRQGGAIFGDYLFQFHNTLESIVVFKLSTATTVQTISLTAQPDCHANSGGFGKTYHTAGDPFPLLYVSSQSEKKIYVYRITGEEGNWSIVLVQTITVNVDFYLPNIAIDAWNERGVLFGYTKNSWSDTTAKSRICWFNLPPLSSGDVTISDFNDYFTLPYIYAQQGACARFGKMYLSFGNTQQGQATGGIIVIDYTNKNVDSYLDLYAIAPGSFEPEAIGIWGGGLIVTSAGGGVYKLTFN